METEDKTYRRSVIDIVELVDVRGVIEGVTFVDCTIRGPAVLLADRVEIVDTNLGADTDAVFWEIPRERKVVAGAISVKQCKFDRCLFVNIGIAGPEPYIRQIKEASPDEEIPVLGGARIASSIHDVTPPEAPSS